jgi:uncharacterized protein with beta-barrel porin domain
VVKARRTPMAFAVSACVALFWLVAIAPASAQLQPRIDPSDPNIYLSAPSALFDLGTRFLRRIEDETGSQNTATKNPGGGGAPAEQVERRFRTWAEGYGLRSHMSDTNGVPGDSRRTWGFIGGVAGQLAPGVTVGLAVDQGWTKIQMNGLPVTGDIALTQFGVNATIEHGAWTLGLAAIYGRGDIETQNATSFFMGVPGVAFADYRAQLWGTIAELGYYIGIGNTRIIPKIGLDYQRTEADAFTETGIPNPVTVAAQSSWRWRGLAGVEVGHSWASHTTMFDLAGYARAVEILDQQLPVAFVTGGGAPPATFLGVGESRFGVDAGASASVRFAEVVRLYALYDGRFRRNFTSHGGTLGVEVRF